MLAFILRRLLQSVVVMLFVALIAFSVFRFVGDPVASLLGQESRLQDYELLREQLGLPHTVQGVDGFDERMAKALAPLAAADPSLGTNPKPCTLEELEAVFLAAWRGDLSE